MSTVKSPISIKDTLLLLSRKAREGILSIADASMALGLSRQKTATRLYWLVQQGWLKRIRRGLYLVLPLESNARTASVVDDPWILAKIVYAPCYIGGWTAAEQWGLTEQLFRSIFAVTTANVRSGSDELLSLNFRVVKVSDRMLQGTDLIWRGREQVAVSGPEKTIADAMRSPDWVAGVRHLNEIFSSYVTSDRRELKKLLDAMEMLASGAAYKRLGYLTEQRWPKGTEIIEASLKRRSKGMIKLDPSVKSRGKFNKKWGLWVNVDFQ